MEPVTTWGAPLVADGVAAEPTDEPVALGLPVALPLAIAGSAPGVGAPKVVTPDGIGPTGTEAEAPMPTKNPTFCCRK